MGGTLAVHEDGVRLVGGLGGGAVEVVAVGVVEVEDGVVEVAHLVAVALVEVGDMVG